MTVAGCLILVACLSLTAGSAGDRMASTDSGLPAADSSARLAELIRGVLLPGWHIRRDDNVIRVSGEVTTRPPSAAPGSATERHTYDVVVTTLPALDNETQRQQLGSAEKLERQLWRSVAKLECDGKEFSDHYVDGLCFRTKTDVQERRVAAYRRARTALEDVPRHHFGPDLAVSVRVHGPEPTDGACSECGEMARRIELLLSPYPERSEPAPSKPAHRLPRPRAVGRIGG
jgi:hypothetical protein